MSKKLEIFMSGILVFTILASFTGCDDLSYSPDKPDDATLSALSVDTGALSPEFEPDTAIYTVSLSDTVSSIKVIPTTTNPSATVKVNTAAVASGSASEAISLAGGINTIIIEVTAANDSTTKYYTVKATVGGINLSGTLTLTCGEDATGKDFRLRLGTSLDVDDDEISLTGVWTSGSIQDYQLIGVPEGKYYLYAVIDWNGDGKYKLAYPDYAGVSGFAFDSLGSFFSEEDPPGNANIIITADCNLTVNITDIQQIPDDRALNQLPAAALYPRKASVPVEAK